MSNKVKPLRTERFPRKLVHQWVQPRDTFRYNVKTRDITALREVHPAVTLAASRERRSPNETLWSLATITPVYAALMFSSFISRSYFA